jgi:hypothetical protein
VAVSEGLDDGNGIGVTVGVGLGFSVGVGELEGVGVGVGVGLEEGLSVGAGDISCEVTTGATYTRVRPACSRVTTLPSGRRTPVRVLIFD